MHHPVAPTVSDASRSPSKVSISLIRLLSVEFVRVLVIVRVLIVILQVIFLVARYSTWLIVAVVRLNLLRANGV